MSKEILLSGGAFLCVVSVFAAQYKNAVFILLPGIPGLLLLWLGLSLLFHK